MLLLPANNDPAGNYNLAVTLAPDAMLEAVKTMV